MDQILLRHYHGLGDTVGMTGLVRDMAIAFPRLRILVDTAWKEIWENNPHAKLIQQTSDTVRPRLINLNYATPIIEVKQGAQTHLMRGLYDDLARKTGMRVPMTLPHGDIHLTAAEIAPLVSGPYWIVIAGVKANITTKQWHVQRYQEVVDAMRERGVRFVQVGDNRHDDTHPSLERVLNAVGRTRNLRDMLTLVRNADGILCGVTAAMHLAACFHKPCVVLAGGREAPVYEAYVNANRAQAFGPNCAPIAVEHRYLHTVGTIPCAKTYGCWKGLTVPSPKRVGSLCALPVLVPNFPPVPACLDMISVEHVTQAMQSYYDDGTIPMRTATEELQFLREPGQRAILPQKPARVNSPATGAKEAKRVEQLLDHPILGGKVTICVLCYGNYFDLAKRCLDSIIKTVPLKRVDIRVFCNECCGETVEYMRKLPLRKVYTSDQNIFKYPALRQMFHDPSLAIETNYLIWFDDDSYCLNPHWLEYTAETIIASHPEGGRIYGWRYYHDLKMFAKGTHDPLIWFKQAHWYHGKYFFVKGCDQEAPNGSRIKFVTGGWWALDTQVALAADIPDHRLLNNGGDIVISEQVHQLGYKVVNCNENKKYIFSSGAPRRGATHRFPWANP